MPNEETPEYNLTDEGLEINGNLYLYSKIRDMDLIYSWYMKILGFPFLVVGTVFVASALFFLPNVLTINNLVELFSHNGSSQQALLRTSLIFLPIGILMFALGILIIYKVKGTNEIMIIYGRQRIIILKTRKRRYAVAMFKSIKAKLKKFDENEGKKSDRKELKIEDIVDPDKLKFLDEGMLYHNEKMIMYDDINEVRIQYKGVNAFARTMFSTGGRTTCNVILVMKDDRWLTVYSTYHKKDALFTKESIEKRMRGEIL